MNDYLAESRGTLARTAQKKQTAISIYHRQQQLRKKEEKYGFSVRPSNPNLVDRPDAVEFYFKEVYGEASNKIAQLQQMDASAIDREGEGPIRKLNKEANDLIYERARWGRRLVDVGGSVPEAQLKPAKKMTYFGAAKFLPEALAYIKAASEEAKKKKVSAESGDDELGEEEHFAQEGVSAVNNIAENEEGVQGDSSDITTTRSLRWLPLSAPTAATTPNLSSAAAAVAISGWNGLEWMDDEERKLRQLEAVALQQNIGTSRVLSEKAARPLTSTAQSIRGGDDEEKGEEDDEEADYTITTSEGNINKEREVKTAGTTREKKGEEETTVVVANHHLNGIAKSLLACTRTGSSGAAAVATSSDSLPSEKEFQMRAFAAKKVMMLQQLNRNK